MKNRERTNYAFRFEWSDKIAHLSPLVRLEVYEAATYYAKNGRLPEMSDESRAAFCEFVMPDFKRREKAAQYRKKARARRAEAAAEPRAAATVQSVPENQVQGAEEPTFDAHESKAPHPAGPNRRQRRRMEMEARRAARKKKRSLSRPAASL